MKKLNLFLIVATLIIFPLISSQVSIGETPTDFNDVLIKKPTITSTISGNLTTFIELTDTPSSYTGDGDKCVTVKNDETGLEFTTCSGGGGGITNISEAGDVDVSGVSDNDVLKWNDAVKQWIGSTLNSILSFGNNYLFFSDDNEITFNETKLNETISSIASELGGNASWNESLANDLYVNIDGDNMTGNLNMTDNNITNVDCITLSNGQPMCWNEDAFTMDIPTGAGNTIQVGQELTLMRKNKEDKIIYAGQIVYDSGSQGERITVELADASNGSKIHNLGIVTITMCNDNADCPITYFGDVHDLDTSLFSEGDSLYLSDDGSGNVTTTIPGGLNYSINIGTVSRVHASTGIINFQPEIDYGDDPLFMDLRIANNLVVNEESILIGNVTTQNWFRGLFNWTVLTNWLFFDGSTLSFNETKLNETGDIRYVNINGDNMTGDLLVPNINLTSNLFLNQDINISPYFWLVDTPVQNAQVVNKEYVDSATSSTAFDFFFTNQSSDIGNHFNMTEIDEGHEENSLDSVLLTTTGTFSIFNFTTKIGQPEFNELRNGVYDVHIHVSKSGPGTKDVQIIPKLYNISSDGTSRTLLVTFETSPFLTIIDIEYDLHGVLSKSIILSDGNRLNLELEAIVTGTGGNPIVTITQEGITDSHMSIATSTNAFEKIYIRRDGSNELTNDWDAGDFNITTTKWFRGLFNWTTISNFLFFDGATLSFNETKLNETIILEASVYNNTDLINTKTLERIGNDSLKANLAGGNSFTGDQDFGGGIGVGGTSIRDGEIWTQDLYAVTITGTNVSTLNMNGSINPSLNNTFDIGQSNNTWQYGYFGTDVIINGVGVKQWLYNQTIPANVYTDNIISSNNVSWLSTFNTTYDSHIQDNESWNESLADTLYLGINSQTGNASWNQSRANELYADIRWNYNQTEALNPNLTQMDFSDGNLNIKESWLTTLWNAIFGTKTTDDLAEGSTNKYEDGNTFNTTYNALQTNNNSWNESLADTLYAPNTTAGIQYLINSTGVYSTFNTTYDGHNQNNDSWNQSMANELYSEIKWSYNQTLGVNQVYVEGLGFIIGPHTIDTNESNRFNNLTLINCLGNDKMIGVYANGTVQCSAVAGGGDFSFADYQASFNSNFSEKTTDDLAEGLTNKYEDGNTYNATYDAKISNNESWNQSFADTLYSPIDSEGGNLSFNQTLTNTLYANIQWNYNQTIPAITYTDEVNQSQSSWIESVFLKIVDMFTKNEINDMISGNKTEANDYTDQVVSASNASWTTTYNATYDAKVTNNDSWNETNADGKYALIIWGYNQTDATFNLYDEVWSTTYNATYDALDTNNNSWNETRANELYSDILWGYNQTLGVDQVYVEGLGFVTGSHTIDTNESNRFNNLTSVNCVGTDKMIGVYPNGTVECSEVVIGGDFSFADFQASFDSNFSDETTDSLTEGSINKYEDGNTYNATYDAKVTDNASWNQSLADGLYADIEWNYNQTDPAMTYTDEVNTSQSSWIDSVFLKIIDMFTKNEITDMIDGNLTEAKTYTDGEITSVRNDYVSADDGNRTEIEALIDLKGNLADETGWTGTHEWNGGFASDGVSISGGDIFAQQLFVFNITGVDVNTLNINGSILPQLGFTNTFDIGTPERTWRDLNLGGEVHSNGTGNNYFLGNVGIGTASPTVQLHINGNDPQVAFIQSINGLARLRLRGGSDGSEHARIDFSGDSSNDWRIRELTSGDLLQIYDDINNIGVMTFKPGGNVGIGTDSPGAKLEVAGSIEIGDDANIYNDATGVALDYGITFRTTSEGGKTNRLQFKAPSNIDFMIDSNNNQADTSAFTWGKNASSVDGANYGELMRLTEAGNVGIGTDSPESKLEILGGGFLTPSLTITSGVSDSLSALIHLDRTIANRWASIRMSTDNVADWWAGINKKGGGVESGYSITTVSDLDTAPPQFYISTGGNIGIGTASPNSQLHLSERNGNLTLGEKELIGYAEDELIYGINWYNSDTSSSGAQNVAFIKGIVETSVGAGGYLTFGTNLGTTGEGNEPTVALTLNADQSAIFADDVTAGNSFLASLGAVGTPSYTFTGDDNTGMWSSFSNTLNFATGGTDRMKMNAGGIDMFINLDVTGTIEADTKYIIDGSDGIDQVITILTEGAEHILTFEGGILTTYVNNPG